MASGGGGSHPSHLPIYTPPHTSPFSMSSSLQTPDTSALFISSLGGKGGNTGNTISLNQESHPSSFTSLEELLDATGINSMGLNQSGVRQSPGHGVNSLQLLAREVEKSSGSQGRDSFHEPPSKRLRLNSSHLSSTPSPQQTSLVQGTANARVQSLGLPSSSSTSLIASPSPPSLLYSSSSPATPPLQSPTTPIASLLDKRHSTASSTTSSNAPSPLPNAHHPPDQYRSMSAGGGFMDRSSKVSPLQALSPRSVGTATSATNTTLGFPQPGSLETHQKTQTYLASNSFTNHYLPDMTVQQASSLVTGSLPSALTSLGSTTHPSSSIMSQSSLASLGSGTHPLSSIMSQRSNFSTTNTATTVPVLQNSVTPPTSNISQPQNPRPGASNGSHIADNINSNSKAVVVQLIQLYKQYQTTNDHQGMLRVREQINFLVSAQQKILTAQKNVMKSATNVGSSTMTSSSNNSTSAVLNGPVSHSVSLSSRTDTKSAAAATMTVMNDIGTVAPQTQQQQQQHHQFQQQPNRVITQLPKSQSTPLQQHQHQFHQHQQQQQQVGTNTTPVSDGGPGGRMSIASTTQRSRLANPPGTQSPGIQGGVRTSVEQGLAGQRTTLSSTLKTSQEDSQRAVKQIQLLMASLPESKRPKTIQELKDFVQKYSTLINKGSSFLSNQATSSSSHVSSERSNTSISHVSGGPLSHVSMPLMTSAAAMTSTNLPLQSSTSMVGTTTQTSSFKSLPAKLPLTVPPVTSAVTSLLTDHDIGALKHHPSFSSSSSSSFTTIHAPVTSQFKDIGVSAYPAASSVAEAAMPLSSKSAMPPLPPSIKANSGGIRPGVAIPLPAGLTLETLGVLCKLPESDLLKLNLPQPLLSAIKVWKARQTSGGMKTKATNSLSKSNIPILIPPLSSEQSSSLLTSSGLPTSARTNIGTLPSLSKSSLNHTLPSSLSKSSYLGQPNVIPSGAGFPPRSLYAVVPRSTTNMGGTTPLHLHQSTSSMTHTSQHMTRYKLKVEQQKAETERIQALQKALQSSEEARIAFRFSAHLEKMHNQLMNPDTVTSFRSQHDILARLLPYHLYAEPEPLPAAAEKADAVFESVAQVLLSRSKGLRSKFEQSLLKMEAHAGLEQSKMNLQLVKLFVEGEQERIQQEKKEKKEAEQIAADLSMMADTVDSFDADFSFGDVFDPMMSMNPGVT